MNFLTKKEKTMKIILWSFGSEGKTTLLYKGFKEKEDFPKNPITTVGFNVEEINFNGINMIFWDIGGACKIKEFRNHYLPYCDAIIYLIDSSELILTSVCYSSFKYNFEELQKCIKIIEDKPLLIAITKVDERKSSTLDIINGYQLNNLFERKQKFGIIECSSFTSQGIKEIKYWLSSINKK